MVVKGILLGVFWSIILFGTFFGATLGFAHLFVLRDKRYLIVALVYLLGFLATLFHMFRKIRKQKGSYPRP